MHQDLRLALASLRREPRLAALVMVVLAASLGVHTAVFSLVNAAFWRPLPYADAERLVVVQSVSSKTGGAYGLSIPDADDYRRTARQLVAVGSYEARRDNLIAADGRVTSIPSASVTAGVLPAAGVRPLLGRLFDEQDDRQGADSFKAVIGHGLWRSHFGSDPEILGRTLETSLATYQVIGVLPPGFGFPFETQLWIPSQSWIDTQDTGDQREDQRAMRWNRGIARLAPGSTLEQAQAELESLAAELAERHPKTNGIWSPRLVPYRQQDVASLAPHLRSLFAMTWVFMVLAAVNLAGLQAARGIARTATFSLQLALGASGARLRRQLLIETLILVIPGALAGLGLAKGLLTLLPHLVPTSLPTWLDLRLGSTEIGFAASAAFLVALVADLAPLAIGRRMNLRALLAGRSTAAAGGTQLRSTLVIAEVALAAVLLVAAGLLARSFSVLEQIDPGFEAERVASIQLSPQAPGSYLEQVDSLAALYRRVQERLLEVPGVDAVGGSTHLPYLDRDRRPVTLVARGGEGEEELERQAPILTVDVTPGYFAAMGIPIVEGRDFTWSDSREDGLVIVLSRRAADELFPGQSPIGKEARIANDSWARVIGVTGDVRYDPREEGFGAELYYPITQYKAWRQRVAVSFQGSLEAMAPALRRALEEAAPAAGVVEIRSMSSILDESLWQSRLLGRLAPLFAAIALLLASLGVYGLLAHDLARKRQELGVRSALGAPGTALARLVLWRGFRLVVLGVAVGAVLALAATPLLAASLFGVAARDPASLVVAAAALLAVGGAACLVPARRAMRIHPTEALNDT